MPLLDVLDAVKTAFYPADHILHRFPVATFSLLFSRGPTENRVQFLDYALSAIISIPFIQLGRELYSNAENLLRQPTESRSLDYHADAMANLMAQLRYRYVRALKQFKDDFGAVGAPDAVPGGISGPKE